MNRRVALILLLFILVLIVIIAGNYIHILFTRKSVEYEDRDTYHRLNKENLIILIEVDKKRLSVIDYRSNKILGEYVVATGRTDSLTPLGTFRIAEKARWGEGFGSRWLGLNVPWGNYGIHGTNNPGSIGYNASAGCIRMRNKDVEQLYEMVDQGTIVSIVNGKYGPFNHGFRDLVPGDIGADVLEVQKRLKLEGYYDGPLDGIYGEGMKRGLIQYLKDRDIPLSHTVDDEIYRRLKIMLME
ncbi:MAG: L,D-transpeptidase family protein [Tissierellia bacterium]|nr:L,D-transpeptidase family protein [Tissierellia bacterium]